LEVLPKLANQGKLFAYKYNKFWLSIKSAGSALFANRAILKLYRSKNSGELSESKNYIGNVSIHPSADVHPAAVVSSKAKFILYLQYYSILHGIASKVKYR